MTRRCRLAGFLISIVLAAAAVPADAAVPTPMLTAYGGHNETMVPIWVGAEKGLFRKYGVDLRALQTRSGPIMMATLASGGTPLVWAAPSSALSTTASGLKLGCFAVGNNRVPREIIVRKGIESIEDLRGKSFGVQSIGGGFWISTMVVLDALGIDPDKYKLNMRVIGDTGTVTQALITGNVDAMVVPYSYADVAKRAGAKALADAGKANVTYQATVMCAQKDSTAVSSDTMIALTKGVVDVDVLVIVAGKAFHDGLDLPVEFLDAFDLVVARGDDADQLHDRLLEALLNTNLRFRRKPIKATGTARIAPAAKALRWNDFSTAIPATVKRYVTP